MQQNKPARAGTLTAAEQLPAELIRTDICVIGAGSGGLSVAAAAAAFGRNVVLIEKHKMGGDCLNFGCVPSKALLAAGKRAHAFRTASKFGMLAVEPQIDHRAVNGHVKSIIAAIAPNDSVERFTGLGVRVILGAARFIDRRTVAAGDYQIKARRFVIATGSSPVVPPIPGLDQAPYFTNETIFDNDRKLSHLLIIGGGPIGLEMAQAHARLGSRVTVLEGATALSKDDPELAAVVLKQLRAEGIEIREGTTVDSVETLPGVVRVHATCGGHTETISGTHILVAAGRRPNLSDLNLAAAGIKFDKRGITVDRGLRTSNRRTYAIGDVAGGLQFTHVANYHAGIVIRRALFWIPAKVNNDIVPWVTFTDPELAHVGLTEATAAERKIAVNVLRWPYHENDRAQAERETEGHIKVVTDKKGRILGATIVGAHAGELIQMWALALSQGMKIGAMTGWISPYPTLGEIGKRAAYRFYAIAPSKPIVRKVINFLAKLG
ncbi:MAG: FAD-dependent oxidoreductase [Hyphomicrobium sp.]|jgi:pyruvate/2-oxoglutarate dehydrogenase complex dihydrolipoamide dehydrogenase (E3) component